MAGPATPFQSPTFDKDVTIDINEEYTAASISPSGRDVVLAGTQGLLLIDLDSPYSRPRFIRYPISFKVADVQWSPFACRSEWVVSTNNNKAVIFNLNQKTIKDDAPVQFVLDAHQGNITDINFSAHHPDVLATCALDTNILAWDLRTASKPASAFNSTLRAPAVSFADWEGGATQVKWNRQNEYILASSHDRYVRVWDIRRGAQPITTIHAHYNKVYGIDWHRADSGKLLTCSLDKTVKQWDRAGIVQDISEPSRTIFTEYPLLRARHTPFANGIVAMPQLGSAALSLYSQKHESAFESPAPQPRHVFADHDPQSGRLHEFLWRSRGGYSEGRDHREFQLVTWATDHKLRLFSVSPHTLKQAVGFERGARVEDTTSMTRKGARYITYANGPITYHEGSHTGTPPDSQSRAGALSSLLKSAGPAASSSNLSSEGLSRPTMTARSVRRTPNQRVVTNVTWMHNVNIERRKTDADGKAPEPDDGEKYDPAAEIKATSNKFLNVEFEEFDHRLRKIVVAFLAPWGYFEVMPNGRGYPGVRKTVFLRLSIRFPDKYPGSEESLNVDNQIHPLEVTIEKTTADMAPSVIDFLKMGVNRIAETYAYSAQPSLEAVLSFVLGDVSLEDILKQRVEESSSEEEEEEDSETGDFNKDLMLSSHSNTNIPLPAQTLIRWSNAGVLALVSAPRLPNVLGPTRMSSSAIGNLTDPIRLPRYLRQNPNKDDIFETFGRITTQDSDSPGSSLVSWESSSSASSSSGSESDLVYRNFLPPLPWQKVSSRLFAKSSLPSSADPTNAYKTQQIVTLLQDPVAEFIPSKKVLAQEYMVFGDGPMVCLHNAQVARKHGFEDLADVWELCKLILTNEVPLEILPQQHRRDQVLVLARRALVRIKRKDSGLDLKFDEADTVTNPMLRGRVKWGHHPVVTWLIPALFDHFERLADTQMLAMLSCVFSEPAAREGVPSAMANMRQSHLPMSMEAPAFSLDYFSSPDAAWSLFKSSASVPSTPAYSKFATPVYEFGWHRLSRNLDTYGSHGSSNGPWANDGMPSEPVTPYSTGNTPPNLSRAPTFRFSTAGNTPYGTSPEQSQTIGKKISSAGFSNALANLGKSFISASPPVKSRTEDLSSSLPTNGVTWGATTFYGSASQERGLAAPRAKQAKRASFGQADQVNIDYYSDSDSDYDTLAPDAEPIPAVSVGADDANGSSRIKVTLKNQDQFDDEASVSAPLLDMTKEWLYRAWREQYAELLGCWGLISKRAEVLKFNGLVSYFPFDDQSGSKAGSVYLGLKKDNQPQKSLRTLSRTSALAPPVITTAQFKRSPLSSPRGFSFNPEATEFKPGGSFSPEFDPLPFAVPEVTTPHTEQYLRLNISAPVPDLPAPTFNLSLTDARLSTYSSASRSRPSLSRGTSNISGRSSNALTSTAVSPTKKTQADPIYSCCVCWIRVSGRFYLCPACGHVTHFACLPEELALDIDEGECVIGCGCGCGLPSSDERGRIEEFIEGARGWEERGGWLPEVEFDEDASTRAGKAFDLGVERRKKEKGREEGKPKVKKKARLTGKSYF